MKEFNKYGIEKSSATNFSPSIKGKSPGTAYFNSPLMKNFKINNKFVSQSPFSRNAKRKNSLNKVCIFY